MEIIDVSMKGTVACFKSHQGPSEICRDNGINQGISILIILRSRIVRKLLPPTAWQQAAFAFAIAAFVVFILNLSFILWATANRRHTLESGIGTISEQGCSATKRLNTFIHLAINVMSTILLAGSNYCMQCVVAPSRSEVDAAHAREKWFDIGVQSTRNLWNISWRKKLTWLLLALSSIPLHLVYGSSTPCLGINVAPS